MFEEEPVSCPFTLTLRDTCLAVEAQNVFRGEATDVKITVWPESQVSCDVKPGVGGKSAEAGTRLAVETHHAIASDLVSGVEVAIRPDCQASPKPLVVGGEDAQKGPVVSL